MHAQVTPYETLARWRKVAKMIERVDELAAHAGLNTKWPHDARRMVAVLRSWPDSHWASLAIQVGSQPPSAETRRLVVEHFKRKGRS